MVDQSNHAQLVAAFGRRIFGDAWGAGLARLAGVNPRTMTRIAAAARDGRDYPAARGVLAALHQALAPIVAELADHAREGDR